MTGFIYACCFDADAGDASPYWNRRAVAQTITNFEWYINVLLKKK